MSTRAITTELNMNHVTVYKIIKHSLGWQPFKHNITHKFKPGDMPRYLNFYEWIVMSYRRHDSFERISSTSTMVGVYETRVKFSDNSLIELKRDQTSSAKTRKCQSRHLRGIPGRNNNLNADPKSENCKRHCKCSEVTQ